MYANGFFCRTARGKIVVIYGSPAAKCAALFPAISAISFLYCSFYLIGPCAQRKMYSGIVIRIFMEIGLFQNISLSI